MFSSCDSPYDSQTISGPQPRILLLLFLLPPGRQHITGSTGSIKMFQYVLATNQMEVLILTGLNCFGGLRFSYISLRIS